MKRYIRNITVDVSREPSRFATPNIEVECTKGVAQVPRVTALYGVDTQIYTVGMVAYSQKRRLGDLGEDIACRYLSGKGFQIIDRNYLKPWGEIDIIAMKDGVYRFVEVKSISRGTYGTNGRENMTAEDHIHPAKMKKLVRTVEVYMAHVKGEHDFQIDVVTVELDTGTRKAHCKLYEQVL